MSNEFQTIFDVTARFLESRGVKPVIFANDPASLGAVKEFRETTGLELPKSFLSFYTGFSNGYSFEWEQGPEEQNERGAFIMPTLEELAGMHRDWDEMIREDVEDPQSMDECIAAEFRPAAYQLMQTMRTWVPFIEEAETGDSFCVSPQDGKILFSKLDWFDGFGEEVFTNGLIAGETLLEFIETWSHYCFITMWFTDSSHEAGTTHVEWDAEGSQFIRD